MQGNHDDPEALDTALRGIDVVYHLAKATGQRWDDYLRDDVEPTRVLAEAVLAHGVKRFVYTGTIDSYDSADARAVIDARTPVDARIASRNLYARSKAACEALLQRMHAERGLPLVIFRPGVVIGAGSPPAHWGVGMFHSDTRAQLWGEGTHQAAAGAGRRRGRRPRARARRARHRGQDVPPHRRAAAERARVRRRGRRGERDAHRRDADADLALLRCSTWPRRRSSTSIRHPNRRVPSYRDWDCRAHRARYDSSETRDVLGWKPAGTREAMVERRHRVRRPSLLPLMRAAIASGSVRGERTGRREPRRREWRSPTSSTSIRRSATPSSAARSWRSSSRACR